MRTDVLGTRGDSVHDRELGGGHEPVSWRVSFGDALRALLSPRSGTAG